MSRYRAYVFTWNNFPQNVSPPSCRYFICQEEIAPSTGKHHLQGFIYFTHAKTPSAVRKLLPGAHLEPAKHIGKAINYCRKSATSVPNGIRIEHGEKPHQGARKPHFTPDEFVPVQSEQFYREHPLLEKVDICIQYLDQFIKDPYSMTEVTQKYIF